MIMDLSLDYELSFIGEAWLIHWLPLTLGVGAFLIAALKKTNLTFSSAFGFVSPTGIFWLATMVWAWEVNLEIYWSTTSSTHPMLNMGALLVTSEYFLGAALVLANLVLLEWVTIFVFGSQTKLLEIKSRHWMRSKKIRDLTRFLVVIEVLVNYWLVTWGLALYSPWPPV